MIQPNPAQLAAAVDAVRRVVNASGYGGFVHDEIVQQVASDVAVAVLNASELPSNPEQPLMPE